MTKTSYNLFFASIILFPLYHKHNTLPEEKCKALGVSHFPKKIKLKKAKNEKVIFIKKKFQSLILEQD